MDVISKKTSSKRAIEQDDAGVARKRAKGTTSTRKELGKGTSTFNQNEDNSQNDNSSTNDTSEDAEEGEIEDEEDGKAAKVARRPSEDDDEDDMELEPVRTFYVFGKKDNGYPSLNVNKLEQSKNTLCKRCSANRTRCFLEHRHEACLRCQTDNMECEYETCNYITHNRK